MSYLPPWLLTLPLAFTFVNALSAEERQAVLPHCQVLLHDDVQIPAQETGRLEMIAVVENQTVRSGELLGKIDDRAAQVARQAAEAERKAAQARADDDIDVRYAIKEFELRDAELSQDLEILKHSPGAVPAAQLRRKQLDRTRAQLGIARTELDHQVAALTAEAKAAAVVAAEANLERCRILAPFDGIVAELLRQPHEWVRAGDPVVRLIRLDRLRVEGFVDASLFDPAQIVDRQVDVQVELARGRTAPFSGRVVMVNPIIQTGNKYRVRAEVENRAEGEQWLLRPGMAATLTIHLD